MEYTFAAHVPSLIAGQVQVASANAPTRLFALIDLVQIEGLGKRIQHLLPEAPSAPLFRGCFAEAAIEMSPLLIELSGDAETLTTHILSLDQACKSLPILSFIRSTLTLEEITQHLQSLLHIEADGTFYLLRLADSQMLAAANAALSPTQRACFFAGIQAWWIVDYQGKQSDMASCTQAQPANVAPLKLDAGQTHALLSAAAVSIVAAQMRNLEITFAQKLSHAQQIAFVSAIVSEAGYPDLIDDAELMEILFQRWQAQQDGEIGGV